MAGGGPVVAQNERPFWVCLDLQQRKNIQVEPCDYAPDEPASGSRPIQRPREQDPQPRSRVTRAEPINAMEYWPRLLRTLDRQYELREILWTVPAKLLYALFIAFVAGLYLWKRMWPRIQRRRLYDAAKATRDPSKSAMEDFLRRRVAAGEDTLMLTSDQRPLHWTPELLRSLPLERFTYLCQRLWQLRGLDARIVPIPDRREDSLIILRHPAAPDRDYGVAWCRARMRESVGPGLVNDLRLEMDARGCDYGALMCASDLNIGARDAVRGTSIELKGVVTLMIEIDALADHDRASLFESNNLRS